MEEVRDQGSGTVPSTHEDRSVARELRHRLLAARTVAVSFRAAMESADAHLRVPVAEREQIKERWRAWALRTLEGYAAELDELLARQPPTGEGATEALDRYREELDRAFDTVRTTVGD